MTTFNPAEHESYSVVLYTDGSARPNPGFCGSGLHGYVYRNLKDKDQPTRFNGWIATDQGYKLKQEVEQGQGTPVAILQYLDCYQSYADIGTNNQAEINAVSMFFECYPELAKGAEQLFVLADSRYVLDSVSSYLDKWKASNWFTAAGTPVKNQDEWKRLNAHIDEAYKSGRLMLDWVKGHSDDFGNVRADYMAAMGTNLSTRGHSAKNIELSDPLGYHKSDWELHPFLNQRRIYFNTDPTYNLSGVYYQTGWSDAGHVEGRRSSDSTFSVVKLDQPEKSIETLIQAQCDVDVDFNSLVYIKLDRLKMDEIQKFLSNHGTLALFNNGRGIGLNFLDNKPVTVESAAGELSLRAIDVLNHLEQILRMLVDPSDMGAPAVYKHEIHDVTDHFYDLVEKKVRKDVVTKRELKKAFGVGAKKTEIPLSRDDKTFTAHILFGDDLPSRNALKSLEDLHPEVYVITWKESQKVLRYAAFIKANGACGIWCNYFANYVLLDALQPPTN